MSFNKLIIVWNNLKENISRLKATKSIMRHLCIYLCIVSYAFVVFTFTFQNQLIYKLPKDHACFEASNVTCITFGNNNKNDLKVHIVESNQKTDIVFFHGRGISFKSHYEIVKRLTGYNIIYIFQRGYENNRLIRNIQEMVSDTKRLSNFIKKRNKKLVIYGQSLGCHFALYFSIFLNLQTIIVLENPFYSLKSVIQYKFVLPLHYLLVYDYNNEELLRHISNQLIYLVVAKHDTYLPKYDKDAISQIVLSKNGKKIFIENTGHFDTSKSRKFYLIMNTEIVDEINEGEI